MRDVATAAGVSTATVSNVLRGKRFVGPEKHRRVLEAIAELNYRPNRAAMSLRSRRSFIIGIVVPDFHQGFFSAVVQRIEELAAGSDYQILLADSQGQTERERLRIEALIARQADGLILAPCVDESPSLDDVRHSGIPTVVFDRVAAGTDFDSVAVDNAGAAYAGAKRLLELGHRNILMLASDLGLRNIAERVEGYRAALNEAGLAELGRVVFVAGDDAEGGERAMRSVLSSPKRPTAVFTCTNVLAVEAIRAIWSAHLRIPQDISVLSFDDSIWMTALRPFVSVIRQPVDEIAEGVWSTMVDRLAGRPTKRVHREFSCVLVTRESTGRRPGPATVTRPRA